MVIISLCVQLNLIKAAFIMFTAGWGRGFFFGGGGISNFLERDSGGGLPKLLTDEEEGY